MIKLSENMKNRSFHLHFTADQFSFAPKPSTLLVSPSQAEPHQCDDGTLGRELSGTEERPDEPVDLLLLRIVFIVIRRDL